MDKEKTLNKPQAILFDMDGTLFKTESLLLPAHQRLFDKLREEGLYTAPTPPAERMMGSLGMLLEDIWKVVMPDGSERAHARANELLLQLELRGSRQGTPSSIPA